MVIAKAKGQAGVNQTLQIRDGWFGAGAPSLFLEPTGLGVGNKNKTMYETMLNYLFSPFTDKHERWWTVVLDRNKAQEAYSRNSNGLKFKPVVYHNHLKHNFEMLENSTLLELVEYYQTTDKSLLSRLQKLVFSQKKEDEELEEQVGMRNMLSKVTLKNIDDSLREIIQLPSMGDPETKEKNEQLEEIKSKNPKKTTEEIQEMWEEQYGTEYEEIWRKVTTNRKLLEALVYNVREERGKSWEAGEGYSDFNRYDIVLQKGITDAGGFNVKASKTKTPPFRLKLKDGYPYYYMQVILDFPAYFKEIFDEGKIHINSKSAPKKENISGIKNEIIPPSIFGLGGKEVISYQKQFLNDDNRIDKKYINRDTRSQNPPLPKDDFNLVEFLQNGSTLAEKIKNEIRPDVWKEVHLQIKCEIGYDKPIPKKDKDTGKTTWVTGNPKPTQFTVVRATVRQINKIKPEQWYYQQQGFKDEAGKPVKGAESSGESPIIGGTTFGGGAWSQAANPKFATILHSIRRSHDILEDMIK